LDFSLKIYKKLLDTLLNQGFSFQSFQEFIEKPEQKTIILRHDVDKLPENSLHFAKIQHELGIKGSYYFRMVPESFNSAIIQEIARLGHEIGYHYEDIDFATQNLKIKDKRIKTKVEFERELAEEAIVLFEKHLAELRKYYPVKTICMHGSPLSKYDNKLVWKYYNYRDYGIIGEPYFDVDFNTVLYLTDTGRRWNGEKVSIRDKVNNAKDSPLGDTGASAGNNQTFRNTFDIINAAEKGELPNQILFTFHPQRWSSKPFPWVKELVLQNVKNVVKFVLNKVR